MLNNIYGSFQNRTFADIFPDEETFVSEYTGSKLYVEGQTVTKPDVLYYLLYAKYGNSTISSYDETQFKYKLFSLIFSYGPSWEAKLKAQGELRKLLDDPDKLREGSLAVYNHSYNPSTGPSMEEFEPLKTVNDQNATKHKKSLLEAYAVVMEVLKADVTEAFIGKFKKLFLVIVEPNGPLVFGNGGNE